MNKIFLFYVMLHVSTLVFSQENRTITVRYISDPITIDGNLNEAVWQTADAGGDFWQFFPTDTKCFFDNWNCRRISGSCKL